MPKPPQAAREHERRAVLAAGIAVQLRRALSDALATFGDDTGADAPPLTVPRAARPAGPALLAAAHPGGAAARAEAQALYQQCLARYRTLFVAAEAGVDDVGAALARFVAANVEALDTGVARAPAGRQSGPGGAAARLARQMAAIVRASAGWSRAGTAERQSYFERLAILATLVAEASAQAPLQGEAAVEHVRRAARAYLHELLGLDADELTLGPQGLALRAIALAD
jgi:hypothetical protein